MAGEKIIKEIIHSKARDFKALNDRVWGTPEIAFQEFESARAHKEVLEKEGFAVTSGLSGIETAFMGSFGSGSPVIGILGEFDALSEMSQTADLMKREAPLEKGAGHGCGHNTLGASSLAAAAAVKDYLKKTGCKGTIRYYGCPAEEGGGGKTFLVRDGYFDDVDFALTWHPSFANCVLNSGFLANINVIFDFEGRAAHAAFSPEQGRSALDGVELMNIGVNFLREHIIDDARVHYAITGAGGSSPNVVQASAQVSYIIRSPHMAEVWELFDRVKNCAAGAALMTDTTFKTTITAGYSEFLANPALSAVMREKAESVLGQIQYTDEEKAYADSFKETFQKELEILQTRMGLPAAALKIPIMSQLTQPPEKIPGSTDVGDVSWVTPMAQFAGTCYALGTPPHSWQLVAQGKSSIAHKGLMAAAEIMALTAVEVVDNPSLLEKIKEGHRENLGGSQYKCPISKETKPGVSGE